MVRAMSPKRFEATVQAELPEHPWFYEAIGVLCAVVTLVTSLSILSLILASR